jgi:hypothetical protein
MAVTIIVKNGQHKEEQKILINKLGHTQLIYKTHELT